MTRIKNQGPARHGRRSQDKRDKQERHPVDFRGWHSRLLLDRVDGLSKSQGTWTGRAGRPGRGGEKPFGPRCLWSRPRTPRWVAIHPAAPPLTPASHSRPPPPRPPPTPPAPPTPP